MWALFEAGHFVSVTHGAADVAEFRNGQERSIRKAVPGAKCLKINQSFFKNKINIFQTFLAMEV